MLVPPRATVTVTWLLLATVDVIVGASGAAESPLNRRNHLGLVPFSREVAAILPSRPIAMLLTLKLGLALALNMASGVPSGAYLYRPEVVPATILLFESIAKDVIDLFADKRAEDPAPPFAG